MRHVWIFGASGVIGRSIVEVFLKNGDYVVAQGFQNTSTLELFQKKYPKQLKVVSIDLRSVHQIEKIFQEQAVVQNCIQVCIYAAGIARSNSFPFLSESQFDEVMDVNLKSLFYVARCFIQQKFRPAGGSHFLSFSSIAGLTGVIGKANYAASKGAMIGFMKALAHEWQEYKICVNTVLPGWVDSTITQDVDGLVRTQIIEKNLFKSPSDVSQIANWIAGFVQMNQVSGQIFNLDSRIYV